MVEISDLYTNPKARLFAAFMPLPDEELIGNALIVSKGLEDLLESAIIKRFQVEAHEIRNGDEKITRNIPDISEDKLENLDEKGVVKKGTIVKKNDILVGKVSPRQEYHELTPEDRLIRAIFWEERDYRDTSIVMPYEDEGIVIDTKYLSLKKNKELFHNYLKAHLSEGLSENRKEIAEVDMIVKKKLGVGDVLKDSKGNKGVVIKTTNIPVYLRNKRIDIIGSPSSDFISSLEDCEIKSAWHVKKYPYLRLYSKKVKNSKQIAYIKEKYEEYEKEAKKYKYLGEAKIGYLTLERLTTLIEEKITARSTGPYFLISQKPNPKDITGYLKGTMIGEKGLSILKGYPALFKEALTIRSNSVKERVKAYNELIKNGKF
jgi:DNA-directed RNA polymerase subunit beta